jgi:hypothetical protein
MEPIPDVNAYEARIAQIGDAMTHVLRQIEMLREGELGAMVNETGIQWGPVLVHHLALHLESIKQGEEKPCKELRGFCKEYTHEYKKLVSEQKGCKQVTAEAKKSLTDLEKERQRICLEQGNLSRSISSIEKTVETKAATKVRC